MGVDTLRSVDSKKPELSTKNFLIRHPSFGIDVFAAKPIGRGIYGRYHHDFLAYANLSRVQHTTVTYLELNLEVAMETFQVLASRMHENVFDREVVGCVLCIVPEPFRSTRYITDWRHLANDEVHLLENVSNLSNAI